MEDNMKEVMFNEYCPKCLHNREDESMEPCCDCLYIPARADSHKPQYFVEDTNKKEKKNGEK